MIGPTIRQRRKFHYERSPTSVAVRLVILLATMLVTACGPSLTPAPISTPRVLVVQATPALLSLRDRFQACAQRLDNTGLVLLETPAPALDLGKSSLVLRWGGRPTAQQYAALLGQEELAIVVNLRNPLQHISLADLQAIYTGRLDTWPEMGERIQPWAYPPGDDAQQVFEQGVLRGVPFSYRASSAAPDPAAMREAVSGSRGAVGFLPRRWLNDSVKALPVDGLNPADVRQPILALNNSEPEDPQKAWLICLQERLPE